MGADTLRHRHAQRFMHINTRTTNYTNIDTYTHVNTHVQDPSSHIYRYACALSSIQTIAHALTPASTWQHHFYMNCEIISGNKRLFYFVITKEHSSSEALK